MTPNALPTKPAIAAMAAERLPAKPVATASAMEHLPAKPAAVIAGKETPPTAAARAQATENLPTKPAAESVRERDQPGEAHQPPSREPPDQQPPRQAERSGEQYLLLRVRVDNGQLSVVDSRLVDGPLAQATAFQGGFAYEVTYGGQLLHAGSIPDLGTVRSFAHPNGTLEQRRHHTYELSTYEFDARVSVTQLRGVELSGVAIALYRVKQPARPDAPPTTLSAESLAVQREQNLREIGRMVGLPASVLSPGLRSEPEQPVSRRPKVRKMRGEEGEN